MGKALIPKGGNDVVMTPRPLAKAIIEHFKPCGPILDPCRGDGAFYDQFPRHGGNDWCEVNLPQHRDFLTYDWVDSRPFDWIVSNPPWSKLRAFNQRAMQMADNIVWLCTVNHFWLKARRRDMREAGFGIKEILEVDTPAKPWPQSGFQLGAIHLQRGYTGPITLNRL